jgi:putative spermidine/putrescine transport system permease protein
MMSMRKIWSWFWLGAGCLYFFIPLLATFLFSLRRQAGTLSFLAYQNVFGDPNFLASFLFSAAMAVGTILAGFALMVPTVFWIHWKFPKLKPVIETCTLLPFVIPPIVLVFGLIHLYSSPPLTWVTSPALLIAGYIVLAFPYIYRAVDTGLRSMEVKTLMEASLSLGANGAAAFFGVILPNLRTSLLSAAFLTFSIVMGELTFAVMLAWPAFGPYMALVGRDLAYEPAALAIFSFFLTWLSIALIGWLTAGLSGRKGNAVPGGGA